MEKPDDRIIEFIREHHILTLAVCRDNIPWCATCYYVYLADENRFLFTSDHETRHIRDVLEGGNELVAGTIALETRIVGKIRGIQFQGRLSEVGEAAERTYKKVYYKRFPIARLAPRLHLWLIDPVILKMTDNRLGFGRKLCWPVDDHGKCSNNA